MKISMTVICRKDKIYKNNTAPIFIRFTQNRKTRYVTTGIVIRPDDWDFENQRVKEPIFELKEIQLKIDNQIYEYERKMKRLDALDIEVTLDTLLETNNRKATLTIADCFEHTIQRLEALGKYGSAIKHRSILSLLNRFRSPNIHNSQKHL